MIDPVSFKYKENRWQDLFFFLKSKGFEVYPPSTKTGDCLSPYIVVKYDGTSAVTSSDSVRDLYNIMCYVPRNKYSELESLVQSVKEAMAELKPMFLPYDGEQTPAYFDDAVKGHYVGIEYKNYKLNY
jgi:hypothetical protein